MARLTTDPTDPNLGRGSDEQAVQQHETYLILSKDERAKGFVRPVRRTYVHQSCGTSTTMGWELAETYARDPYFYGSTYCVHCSKHRPVAEFQWGDDGSTVGS